MAAVVDLKTENQRKDSVGNARGYSRKKKTILLAAGLTVLLGAAALGIRYWLWSQTHEETDDAYIAGHIHPISSRIAGTVETVLVNDNQHVERGQVLLRLDPRDTQVRLAQAQAALDMARRQAASAGTAVDFSTQDAAARITESDGEVRGAEAAIAAGDAAITEMTAGISKAQADLAEAEANRRRAELDYQRYKELEAKDQVSRQQFDHAQAAYEAAVAGQNAAKDAVHQAEPRLNQAQQTVSKARAQLTISHGKTLSARAASTETVVRKRQHEAAVAAVARAESVVADASLQLSYTEVRSPVAGRIGRKGVEAGQRLQAGQPLLAIVEDNLWVVANYKETQLTKMKSKQEVEITVDSFPDHPLRGRIDSMSPGTGAQFSLLPSDNATGNFTKIVQRVPVKILFDRESANQYGLLLVPGMSVVSVAEVR